MKETEKDRTWIQRGYKSLEWKKLGLKCQTNERRKIWVKVHFYKKKDNKRFKTIFYLSSHRKSRVKMQSAHGLNNLWNFLYLFFDRIKHKRYFFILISLTMLYIKGSVSLWAEMVLRREVTTMTTVQTQKQEMNETNLFGFAAQVNFSGP